MKPLDVQTEDRRIHRAERACLLGIGVAEFARIYLAAIGRWCIERRGNCERRLILERRKIPGRRHIDTLDHKSIKCGLTPLVRHRRVLADRRGQ